MNEIDWQLLIRSAADECTPAERERIERWLTEDPEHAQILAGIRAAGELAGKTVASERSAALLARIRAEYPAGGPRRRRVPMLTLERPRSRVWQSSALRVAAGLALVVGASLVGRQLWQGSSRSVQETTNYSVVSTARGQRLSIRLPDSTLVTLAPGSTLRTPSTYGVRDRSVALEGEAVFTVVHDESRPFTVQTAHAVARDLGTRFVVRAYPGEKPTEVVVAEGVVAVASRDSAERQPPTGTLVITRGERVRVAVDGKLVLSRGVALDSYFDWVDGRLVFRDTPLVEVAAQLARWYDVDIRLALSAGQVLPVTATFERQSAPEALQRIAMSLGLEMSQAGRTFTLSAR